MSSYFSRLAQRFGGSGQTARRTASVALAPHLAAAPVASEIGYAEQQQFVDASPAVGFPPPEANRDPAAGTAAAPRSTIDVSTAASMRPASSHASGVDPSLIERPAVRRIDPYRNDPEDDAQVGIATRDVASDTVAAMPAVASSRVEIAVPVGGSPMPEYGEARSDREVDIESRVDPGRRDSISTSSIAQIVSSDDTRSQARTAPGRQLRTGAVSAEPAAAIEPLPRDAADEVFAIRDRVRADADNATEHRTAGAAVRAQSMQPPAPGPAPAHRAAQGLHVHIGRIEMEVIAPPPRAAHPPPPPSPSPAPAPAPPARDSAFNPHRYYLRGR